jgi:hypothetical protein
LATACGRPESRSSTAELISRRDDLRPRVAIFHKRSFNPPTRIKGRVYQAIQPQIKQKMALPDDLVAAVAEGRAVLFLGSGASRGAKNKSGQEIPDARGLANELINEFLGPDYAGLDFRVAYDLSCSQRDVLTIQRFIFTRLNQFEPAVFHLLIPQFVWAGIITTNYDLIIERS